MNNDTSLSDEINTIKSSNEYCGNIEELLKSENTKKVITILETHGGKTIEGDTGLQKKEEIITSIYSKIMTNSPISTKEKENLIDFFNDEKNLKLGNKIIGKLKLIKSEDNYELFRNYIEDENGKFKVNEIFKAILEKIENYKLVTELDLIHCSCHLLGKNESGKEIYMYKYITRNGTFGFFEVSNGELLEIEETQEDIEDILYITYSEKNFVHFLTKKDDKFLFSTKKYISEKGEKTKKFIFSDNNIKIYIEENSNYRCLKNTENFIDKNSEIVYYKDNKILKVKKSYKYYYYKISNDYCLEEIEELQGLDSSINFYYLNNLGNNLLFKIFTSFTEICNVGKKTLYGKGKEFYLIGDNTKDIYKLKDGYNLDNYFYLTINKKDLLNYILKLVGINGNSYTDINIRKIPEDEINNYFDLVSQ